MTNSKDKELLALLEQALIGHGVCQNSHMAEKVSRVSNEDLPWNV